MMSTFEDWQTIKTFNMSHQAIIVRSMLEAEGIPCFLKDELTLQVDPFYSNALGGAKLQVKSSDFDRAISLLERNGYIEREIKEDFFTRAIKKLFQKVANL
jgi:hypothetical protein